MKEYAFTELGYFLQSECEAIRKKLQLKTFMNFDIGWSNQAGNCILIISTDYDGTEEEIKTFFLNYALASLANGIH